MWEITKEIRFEAAHKLDAHNGKCQRLHGHSWVALVTVAGERLHAAGPKRQMLVDFGDLKTKVLQPLVDNYLDHYYLNETLNTDAPTSEFVAKWLYDNVGQQLHLLNQNGLFVARVQVRETCTSECTYYDEHRTI